MQPSPWQAACGGCEAEAIGQGVRCQHGGHILVYLCGHITGALVVPAGKSRHSDAMRVKHAMLLHCNKAQGAH